MIEPEATLCLFEEKATEETQFKWLSSVYILLLLVLESLMVELCEPEVIQRSKAKATETNEVFVWSGYPGVPL
jgi:ABC-type cobalamin transport system permease subunit